jgi:hypothetical protein
MDVSTPPSKQKRLPKKGISMITIRKCLAAMAALGFAQASNAFLKYDATAQAHSETRHVTVNPESLLLSAASLTETSITLPSGN